MNSLPIVSVITARPYSVARCLSVTFVDCIHTRLKMS